MENKGQERVIIENIKPQVDCGRYPVKRVINDIVKVEADIFCDGHDALNAEVQYRHNDEKEWQTVEMEYIINDRWAVGFQVSSLGIYTFRINAWVDHFRSWHRDILKKIEAEVDYNVDLLIGADLVEEVLSSDNQLSEKDHKILLKAIEEFRAEGETQEDRTGLILNKRLYKVMVKYPVKKHVTSTEQEYRVKVERQKANFSSWYEVFPRSLGESADKHGTFRDCISFLPYIADMGFDVLYLPPIHPIGETNRKGKNNSISAEPGEPGSPWAIGGKEGGHKAIHPQLGSMEDFQLLVREAAELNIEIALDVAFQCSPDHPYVTEHPEWFKKRPDGSLQYAENPPKKYQDIYPIYFETDDWQNLWEELKSVFLFWINRGVKIFRVDNPHTKSLNFWEWVIEEIHQEHPEVIFLSEAFTRPKVMNSLAKKGFTQSYTYFTWRNTKYELTTYCNELVKTDTSEFFRPNFWPNTPDILPEFLQVTNRAGYIQRLVLAATLSSNYGIYGPAFELMDSTPLGPGKEEYLNSEKFELKNWNLEDPKSLRKIISTINRIRRENKALQNTHSLRFHDIDNEALIAYSKTTDDLSNIIIVVVNLDPYHTHSGWLNLPLHKFDMDPHTPYQVHDLIGGAYFLWSGENNYVELSPGVMPVHLFKLRRKIRTEQDFDYFM
ncbi:MAG TPA: alpha-1,4-glucan--maltose-1-phosphate maltosyltransferase [Mariniphaga sp.]|nr:alpha-1,4-glucan--maltose-1-phosphate maltosyltransferase [Mariniphaga sp.]